MSQSDLSPHEVELRDSLAELHAGQSLGARLWHWSREGLALVSAEGRILAVNFALCRMLQYAEPNLVGMHFADVTDSEDREADLELFARLVRGEIDDYPMRKVYRTKYRQPVEADLVVRTFAPEHAFLGQVLLVEAQEAIDIESMTTKQQNQLLGRVLGPRVLEFVSKNALKLIAILGGIAGGTVTLQQIFGSSGQ